METHLFNESQKRFEPVNTKCCFCNKNAYSSSMEENYFSSVYNEKGRTNLLVYRNVKFNEIKIGIPRCKKCLEVHSTVKIYSTIVLWLGIFLFFASTVIISALLQTNVVGMIVIMVIMFGVVYSLVKYTEKFILDRNQVLNEKEVAKKEPLIAEFLRNGWSLDRPLA